MTDHSKKLRIITRNNGEWCGKKCPGLTSDGGCEHFSRRLNLVLSDPDPKICGWHIIAHKRCCECIEYREKKR